VHKLRPRDIAVLRRLRVVSDPARGYDRLEFEGSEDIQDVLVVPELMNTTACDCNVNDDEQPGTGTTTSSITTTTTSPSPPAYASPAAPIPFSPRSPRVDAATKPKYDPSLPRVSLETVALPSRFGTAVYHDSSKTISGSVFCQHKGYVEVLFPKGNLVKDRAKSFWIARERGDCSSDHHSSPPHRKNSKDDTLAVDLAYNPIAVGGGAAPPLTPGKIALLIEKRLMPAQEDICPKHQAHPTTAFTWSCGRCTLDNLYRKRACEACKEKRGATGGKNSALLDKALGLIDAFYRKNPPTPDVNVDTDDDAKALEQKCKTTLAFRNVFEQFYKDAVVAPMAKKSKSALVIPYIVLTELLPCKGNKCGRFGSFGFEFCHNCRPYHHDTFVGVIWGSQNDPSHDLVLEEEGVPVDRTPATPPRQALTGAEAASPRTPRKQRAADVTSVDGTILAGDHAPPLFKVRSIEDSIIHASISSCLLPLGLRVRRFFDGYGFFDASIIQVKRADANLASPAQEGSNFVDIQFVYRLKYHDGDEEDLTFSQIASLRALYDVRYVREGEEQEKQIPLGLNFTLVNGNRGKIVQHVSPMDCVVVHWAGGGSRIGVDPRLSEELGKAQNDRRTQAPLRRPSVPLCSHCAPFVLTCEQPRRCQARRVQRRELDGPAAEHPNVLDERGDGPRPRRLQAPISVRRAEEEGGRAAVESVRRAGLVTRDEARGFGVAATPTGRRPGLARLGHPEPVHRSQRP